MLNPIKVVPYNPSWPDIFDQERALLQAALGPLVENIYHIGSTAIPNMPAKPVIDIILECHDLYEIEAIKGKLEAQGYHHLSRQIIPHQSYFVSRQSGDHAFHLHLHEVGSPQIKRHVNFKDYLIQHPEDAKEYASLKEELAGKFTNDRFSYVKGKDRCVQAIDRKAKLWPDRKLNYYPPNTGAPAKLWTLDKITQAMVANLNVHMTHFGQYLDQVELIRIPGYTIVNSGLPDDTFNYLIDADFTEDTAKGKIEEITDYFNSRHLPFSWWVSPLDKPLSLPNLLEQSGYVNTENNTAMYFELDSWDASVNHIEGLEIIQAKDQKTLHDFARVLTNDPASFESYFNWVAGVLSEDDPIEYYVGYVNGKPVVRGLSCYFGQVAGLHWLSTAPDERHKGYGRAMQEFRLKRAKDLGYHIAVLQASAEGFPLYKKLGYKECGLFREFKLRE